MSYRKYGSKTGYRAKSRFRRSRMVTRTKRRYRPSSYRMQRKLALIPVPETKFTTPAIYASTYSNSGYKQILNGIDYGNTDNSRIGDKVKAVSLTGIISVTNNVSQPFTQHRILIFRDKQANGATPNFTDLFTSGTNLWALRNLDKYKRFKMYKDIIVSTDAVSNTRKTIRINIPFKFAVDYQEAGAGIAAIAKNSLWAFFITDAVTNLPTLNFDMRFRYRDN